MARIRTVKPEAFESEDLASVSLTAERTFLGLLTQADDAGRFRDHPAVIAGRLWALRPGHTATHVARDLDELAAAGLICRYTGCDGRPWLHFVTWEVHQKINKPSPSRAPGCPRHPGGHACGKCGSPACPGGEKAASRTAPGGFREGSERLPAVVAARVSAVPAQKAAAPRAGADGPGSAATGGGDRAGHTAFPEGSGSPPGGVGEALVPGSRIVDLGSSPSGRAAPAPAAVGGTGSAKELVAEYVAACRRRPPEDFLGMLGRKVRVLLEEGFSAGDLRAALVRLREKGLHPSVLPSLVNQVVNGATGSGAPGGSWGSTAPSHTPYVNAAAEPTTFGGGL